MKKVFSLLLVVAMLVSLSLVASAAPANEAGGMHTVITETDTDVTITVYANNVKKLNGFTFNLQTAAVTYAGDFTVNAAFDQAVNTPSASSMKVQYAITSADKYITAASVELCSFKVNKVEDLEEADFSYGAKINNLSKMTTASNSDQIAGVAAGPSNFASNKSAYKQYFTLEYVDDRAPIVEEPDFGATVAGTTITCFGKVDVNVKNYGVEFTAESTVEGARAQKYYGAMPGDTVKDYNGSTTFTFGEWNGTFAIVLEGVHAGEKELNFFANDTIIADTNFTVTVE